MAIVNNKDYNGNDYNASTNPYGFGAGGHKEVVDTDPNYIQLATDIIADGTNSLQTTSTTNISFSTGSKAWTMAAARPFLAGQRVRLIDQNDTTQYLAGTVTSWVSSTLVLTVNVDVVVGSGSSTSWKSTLDGEKGDTGDVSVDDFQKLANVYGTTTGSANTYILTPSTAAGTYTAGHRFVLNPNFTNTGAAQLNVSSQGVKNIFWNGQALTGGEIQSGRPITVVYDGTQFHIVSPIAPKTPITFNKGKDTTVLVGDSWDITYIPESLNNHNLVAVEAFVNTSGTTGTTDIQIHNVTDAVDMLSTKLTIDSGETSSATAATAAVIDSANDDVATGDKIRIDIDAVSTTSPTGLMVRLYFRKEG